MLLTLLLFPEIRLFEELTELVYLSASMIAFSAVAGLSAVTWQNPFKAMKRKSVRHKNLFI